MDINTDLAREELIFTNFAYSQIVLCTIIYLILPFEVAGFIEFMCAKQKRENVAQLWLRIILFACQIAATTLVSLVLLLALYKEFDEELCNTVSIVVLYVSLPITAQTRMLTPRTHSFVYVLCLFISYTFLLQKAKLVSKFDQAKPFYKKMFRAVEVCMFFMLGGGAIGAGLTKGRLTHGGHCVEVPPSPVLWIMLVTNTVTVIALLYLFLQPLKRMAETTAVGINNELSAVFRRNAIISSTAVIGTFILGTVYGAHVILGESTGINEYYTIGLSIMVWDILLLCVALRLTTNMWLPSFVVRVLYITKRSQAAEIASSRGDNNRNISYRASAIRFERNRSITPTGVQQCTMPAMDPLVTIGDIKE